MGKLLESSLLISEAISEADRHSIESIQLRRVPVRRALEIAANPQPCEAAQSVGKRAGRIWDAPAPLRLWHLASLDAPTVAVVWCLAFGWAADVRLPVWIAAFLALAAWTVYVGDRLLDARRAFDTGKSDGLRERHFFHWRHRKILAPLGIASGIAAAGLVLAMMPVAARQRGSILALAACAYLARVHAAEPRHRIRSPLPRLVSKELLAAMIFTAACALPAWNRAASHSLALISAIIFFAALAWLNCHAIDRWEDQSRAPEKSGIAMPACLLGLAGATMSLPLVSHHPRAAALLLAGAVSALLIAVLDQLRGRMTPLAMRAAADLVLLTPLALLWR